MGIVRIANGALWSTKIINSVSLIEKRSQASIIDSYKLPKAIKLL